MTHGPLMRTIAYDRFVELIIEGVITAGEVLSQRDLVVATEMPLAAVREMIPRLEAEGLIRTAPKRGLHVLSINIAVIREVVQIRRILETEAFLSYAATVSEPVLEASTQMHRDLRERLMGNTVALLPRPSSTDVPEHPKIEEQNLSQGSAPHASALTVSGLGAPVRDRNHDLQCPERRSPRSNAAQVWPNSSGGNPKTPASPEAEPEECAREAYDLVASHALPASLELDAETFTLNKAFQALDWGFHQAPVLAMKNQAVADFHRIALLKTRLVQTHRPIHPRRALADIVDEHLAILYALRARNAGRVRGAVQAHFEASLRRSLQT